MNRAYSIINLKSVDDDQRIIEGIASTPEPDRMQDIVELDGMSFKTPFPLLYQHNSRQPIGQVISAKKTPAGLLVKAKLASAGIAAFIDEAWALIKAGLIPGFSIGFRPIEQAYNTETGGYRYLKTEVYEISVVTIPANASATILTVKSADLETLAALGHKRNDVVRLTNYPGAPGRTLLSKKEIPMKQTIQEQIVSFEAKRAASVARMETIMSKAAEESRTLEEAETQEYDSLDLEVKAVDEHIARLKKHEVAMVAKTQPVRVEIATPEEGAAVRRSESITVKSMAPKGIGIARMAIAMVKANNDPYRAIGIAKRLWPDSPEIGLHLKTAVEAGDTTTSGWASQLVPAAMQMNNEFLELLRAETIIDRLPLKKVPFNIAIPIETASGTANWVGEGAAKPVSKLTLTSATLTWAKAACIVAITKELAKFSSPDAEMVVRNSLVKTLVRFFDTQFVGSAAAVSNVSPAGILNGISPVSASGTTAAFFRTDMNNMLNNFTANNVPLTGIWLIMSSTQAVALSLMVTDLGVKLFPDIGRAGGSVLGFPTIISESVGTKIIALNTDEILLASDPGVQVDVSDQASVEMDTEPIQGETSPVTNMVALKSFWQNNLIGIRVEQFVTWKAARAAAVEYINANAYVA